MTDPAAPHRDRTLGRTVLRRGTSRVSTPRITRRGLLIGAAVGGGLLVAWGLTPRRFPLPIEPSEGETAFNAWLRIGRDGLVTVAVPQLEMGQGVSTVLAQVVAMELGADWGQVSAEPAPISGAYANVPLAARWSPLWMPFAMPLGDGDAASRGSRLARGYAERHRFMVTADGTALAAYEQPARDAACAVRTMLAQAAADAWGVDWRTCKVANGIVTHGTHRARFGDLAETAVDFDPPADLPLGPPPSDPANGSARDGGLAYPRLDLPAKAEGAARFGADIRLPGMVFASIRHAPIGRDQALGQYDPGQYDSGRHKPAGAAQAGVRLVRGEAWLAAVGSTWWAADQALRRIAPAFRVTAPVDSQQVDASLDRAVRKAATHRIETRGDPDGQIGDKPSLVARYDMASGLHATLETACCTARLRDGKLELWLATQAPEAARRAAAAALGIGPRNVILYPVPAGGSFDARLEHDHAVEAALIARAVGKPVQLVWSRWQEHLAGKPRAPAAAVLWARTAPEGGAVLAWKTRIATPAAVREFGARLLDDQDAATAMAGSAGRADSLAVEGAMPPYRLGHVSVDHVPVSTGIPAGRLRGNAPAMTAFFTESFVDELARAAGREPLSYRIEMLGNDVRLAECLQRCATLTGWDAGAAGSGQGLACHAVGQDMAGESGGEAGGESGSGAGADSVLSGESGRSGGGGRIAVIATARRDEAGVRVERLTAVVDIGRIVNRDIARQQIEGGLIFGMGQALGASTPYARGLPVLGRLAELSLPVLANTPEIVVEFMESTAPPYDPGELAVAAVAPAIANALHSATGVRFRKLPLLAEEV